MQDNVINLDKAVNFLVGLLNTPSPTGYPPEVLAYCEMAFAELNLPRLTIQRTRKGGLMLRIPGTSSSHPVGLTAHADTLGLIVAEVKPNGRLRVTNLGGIMWNGIEFEGVTVRTADDRRIRGTVVPLNASTHVNPDIRTQPRNEHTMEIRLDIRTASASETRAAGIEVGDMVFVDPRVELSEAGFIRSRFLDDKLGVASIYGALDALVANNEQPSQDTEILISTYEEVGHGGADVWRDDLFELIAVDMAAIGTGLRSDEFHCTLCVKDSGGPYHFDTIQRLQALAAANTIDLITDIYPFYSSDGSAYWRAGGTARVGLIGPGVDASHSYERSHTDALRDTARLILHYLTANE